MSSSARGGTICKVQLIFKAKQAVITVTVCFLLSCLTIVIRMIIMIRKST